MKRPDASFGLLQIYSSNTISDVRETLDSHIISNTSAFVVPERRSSRYNHSLDSPITLEIFEYEMDLYFNVIATSDTARERCIMLQCLPDNLFFRRLLLERTELAYWMVPV